VTAPVRTGDHGIALDAAARAAMLLRCERAVRRARRDGGGVLAGLTVRVGSAVDPSAVVFASRRGDDDWFCFEQPDRDGAALATLGCVVRLEPVADGGERPAGAGDARHGIFRGADDRTDGERRAPLRDDRFVAAAAAWRALTARAVCDPPDGPAGAGLVAVGGFAFAPGGGAAPHWAGFGAAGLTVPELAIARRGRDVRMTVLVLAASDDLPEELVARVERRVASTRA
jgi:salicylate biosynthesis isochorismate synthase